MKKITIIILSITLSLLMLFTQDVYAYTITGNSGTLYNQTTATVGQADVLDIGTNFIEYMYYDLGMTSLSANNIYRVVFSNQITTVPLPPFMAIASPFNVTIKFYNSSNQEIYVTRTRYNSNLSLSYFETNFYIEDPMNIDYITIRMSSFPSVIDEPIAHQIMQSAIIVVGSSQIINQTIETIQYQNGWADAMGSKVEQIWSLWGNIFDTFIVI